MSGTLFFDGQCGMCTRSRNFLLKMNRTGDLQTEPLQGAGTAQRLGIPSATAARIGAVAGSIRRRLLRRRGGQRCRIGRARYSAAAADLPDTWHPCARERDLPMGRRPSLPLPRHHAVLRITSGRLLSSCAPRCDDQAGAPMTSTRSVRSMPTTCNRVATFELTRPIGPSGCAVSTVTRRFAVPDCDSRR